MKKFLVNLVVFSAIFFVVDKCFILVRNASPGFEADKRLEQVLTNKIDADILIYGGSTGSRDVIAQQIADSLGKKTFSLAYPGSNVEFHDYLLDQTLKYDRKPQTIILVVDGYNELMDNGALKFRFDRLFPLVKYEPVRATLVEKGMKNKLMMNLFVLHQLNLNNFLMFPKKFSSVDTVFSDGSMPISYQSKKFSGVYNPSVTTYDSSKEVKSKVAAFKSFVDRCYINKIRLILAFPPNYFPVPEKANKRLQSLAAGKASFMFFNRSEKRYNDPSYYYDYTHLTRNGAVIFTNEVISYLKNNK